MTREEFPVEFTEWFRAVSLSRFSSCRQTYEGAVVAFDGPTGRGRVSVDDVEFGFTRDEFCGTQGRDPLPGEVVSVTLYDDRVERVTAHWEDA
jgi:hypothetical protein